MPVTADTTTVPSGSLLEVNNGPGSTYQAIGRVVKINGIGGQNFALVKATWLGSTAAERKPGLPTNGTWTCDFKFTRATYTQLRALNGLDGFSFRYTNKGGDIIITTGFVYDVPGIENDEAEGTTPLMLSGVKIWVNSFTSYTSGVGTEGG